MDDPDHAAPLAARPRRIETAERRCPACRSEQVALTGQITAAFGVIRTPYECVVCAQRFVLVRASPLA